MIYFPKTTVESNALRAWLEKRIPALDIGDDSWCIAVLRPDGKGKNDLAAVAGFYNFRKVDVEVSFASDNPRWASKENITYMLGFPFIQLNTQRCTAMVLRSNKRCRKFIQGIGFKEEGRHAHAGPNLETMFSYGCTRVEYFKRYGSLMNISPNYPQRDRSNRSSANSETLSNGLVS